MKVNAVLIAGLYALGADDRVVTQTLIYIDYIGRGDGLWKWCENSPSG